MLPIKIAAPDMISNSYLPVLAACELGLFRSLNRFARDAGLLDCDLPYEDVVAEQFQHLWAS